jgi:hypothetical protein
LVVYCLLILCIDNHVSPSRDGLPRYSEPLANGVDISESPSSGQLSYDTTYPIDTLHVRIPSEAPSSSLNIYFDGQTDAEQYENSSFVAMPKCSQESTSHTRSHNLHSDSARDNQPPVSPLTSPSSPETTSSSQSVLNTLLPVTADLRGTEQVSACSSPGSALGSAHASTISLPEPSALLNKCLGMSKNEESQVTSFPVPASHARLLSRVESLSSLSSLSSDDQSHAPAQVPSAPAPSSRRGKAANVRSSTSPKKRRRSSPGPRRGKAAKKPRIKAQSGMTKSMKKELMDGNDVLKSIVSGRKASKTSALDSSPLPLQPLDNATSRQV